MLELVPLLAGGLKGMLENSGFLLGLPLVALGVLGALLVLTPVGVARSGPPAVEAVAGAHPGPQQYITVGLVLAGITAVEVGLYYVDLVYGALVFLLLVLSAMKFVLVALWFMHLQFDNRLLSTLFTGGMALAAAIFAVLLATLGASLV